MARDGYDPLPTYMPPNWEAELQARRTGTGSAEADGALLLVSPPAHYFLNSTFVNVDRLRQREGEQMLLIHPDDAAPREIVDGQMVRVWNERGDFLARARITEGVRPGVCVTPSVWWPKLAPGGRNVNFVTSSALADMGGGATFHDCVVNVAAVI